MHRTGCLTPDLRELAETAWTCVERYAMRMDETFPGRGFSGAIAERIVKSIDRFDPRKSKLSTWAAQQARFACKDEWRSELPPRFRRRKLQGPGPNITSLDYRPDDHRELPDIWMATSDEPELARREAAQHLLRGLNRAKFAIVWGSIIEGRTLESLGREFGLSESRASQIRSRTLLRLKEINRTT